MTKHTWRDYLVDALSRPERVQIQGVTPDQMACIFYKLISEDRVFEHLAITFTKCGVIVFDSRKLLRIRR